VEEGDSIKDAVDAASPGKDDDEDGIDDYEEYIGHISDLDGKIYFTDNRSESTDRDPYDDGQEIDGHSPADLGDFGGQMPARIQAPAKHPLVPSYPDLKVDLGRIDVVTKCKITSTETKGKGNSWTLETETTDRTKTKWGVDSEISIGFPFVKIKPYYENEHETTVRTLESTSGWGSEEWGMATAVDPDRAAKLKFLLKLKNDGTDLAQNVRLTFNVKIGNKTVDTVWTGETPIAGLINPGEIYPPADYIVIDTDKHGNEIVVTLEELKSIELGAPISIELIEVITKVPWGKEYKDWAPYMSDIEEVCTRIMFNFGEGNLKDYRVWSGIRYLPGPPWERYIMNVTLEDAMDWMVGVEDKDDGIYIGGVGAEEWSFGFYHETYEEVVKQLGRDWTIYDLLNLTIKQGWTIVVKVPDTEPPEIHWAGYTGDMKTIRASVSDNENVIKVFAHVKVGDTYWDVELKDEDDDLIFTATLSDEISVSDNENVTEVVAHVKFGKVNDTYGDVELKPVDAYPIFTPILSGEFIDTYDDYVIAKDENLVTIWNNIRVMADHWTMFHHDARHTGSSYSTAPDNNNVLWNYTTGGAVSSSPAVANGKIFVGSHDGKIYCLDEDDGEEIWSYATGDEVKSSPAVAHGKVFAGSEDGKIYCLDDDDGEEIWSYELGGAVKSSPAVADGKVFINGPNAIYCLDEDTGKLNWISFGDGGCSPAVADGKVFIYEHGGDWGYTYCMDEYDGEVIWRSEMHFEGHGGFSSPAVAGGKVFIGCLDPVIFCFDEDTGDWKWSKSWFSTKIPGNWDLSSPAVAHGKVFFGASDKKIYCLDENYGEEIWSYETGDAVASSPAVADGKVFVGSDDGKIYCLNEDTGELIWGYKTGDRVFSSPAVADGKVFVGSDDGKIYCFGSLPLLPPNASIDSI
jgi:outer membrane protein assembly factor BamB